MPTLEELEQQLADMRKRLEAQTSRAEEAEALRQKERLQNALTDALIAQGADPKRLAIAMSHLTVSGTVKLNDKGEPVFTLQGRFGPEEVSAAEGAKRYLATDEGKFFMAPASASDRSHGSRQQGGPVPRRASGEVDWNQVAGRINLAALEGTSDS